MFVLSGVLELDYEGMWLTARGSMLLEAERPLRMRAQETTRLIVPPQVAGQELQRAS